MRNSMWDDFMEAKEVKEESREWISSHVGVLSGDRQAVAATPLKGFAVWIFCEKGS